jgi:Concanavalin A-like lectin/glucanases superfamily/Putative Ig domain
MPTYFDLQNSPVLTTPSTLTVPKITSIGYPGDDTAADPAGGQTITLTGSGFAAGASVIINGAAVGVVSVVSSTTITFTSPAQSAGSYVLYVVNTDGSTAVAVPGIQYSGTPTWTTAAGSLGSYTETVAIANTVTATGDAPVTYSVFSGSLPTGATLNSANGYISGTSPAAASPTTYTFTIRATDAQQQDTNRSFSLTINPDVVTWSSPANGTTYASVANTALANVPLSASAASGQNITYTANALPTGLSISGSNITGTPTVVANSSTLLTATAATTNATATRTINWVISVASDTYFPYVTTLLSASTPASTFVTDASTNSFNVTVVGDTRPSNFGPYTPGYYSNFFGTAQFKLSTTGMTALGSDFTLEVWIYPTSFNDYNTIFDNRTSDGDASGLVLGLTSAAKVYFYTNAAFQITTATSISLNTWTHIALVRSGAGSGNVKIYINGVADANTATYTTSFTRTAPSIGDDWSTRSNLQYYGYLSNLRATTSALYTSSFTPSTSPLTAISGTVLLTCQSNRFIDNSASNLAITRTGDVSVNSFDPFVPSNSYAGYGSGYFDGTGDYLTTVNGLSTLLNNLGTGGDFTVEAWVYPGFTSWGGVGYTDIFIVGSAGMLLNGGIFAAYGFSGASAGNPITLASWTHLAMSRSGGTLRGFQNGVQVFSVSNTTQWTGNTTSFIGSWSGGTSEFWQGYLSNLRVSNNARYTSAFTPSTTPFTADANTLFLALQNNQPNNNSMFLDGSTNNFTITRNGNTTQGTFSPYGGGWSNYFNGSTDYFSMSDNNAFQYGAGDFALECWVYPTATLSGNYIVSQWYTGDKGVILGVAGGSLSFYYSTTGSNDIILVSATNPALNQWSHLLACRTGNTISVYLNGTRVATTTESGTLYNSTSIIGIATHVQGLGSSLWPGYISNLRSIAGSNPYNATQTTITVPTAPLTAVANTRLLICADNRFIDDGPSNFTLTRAGTPSIQRFNPWNPVTNTPTSYSGYFDGTGDYLSLAANSAFDITSGDFTVEMWIYRTANGAEQYLWSNRADTPARGWEWRINATNLMQFFFTGGSSLTSTGTVPTNTWAHLAVSRQTNTVRFFINGALDSSTTFSNGTAVTTSLFLGYSTSGGGYLTGYMSNARLVKGTAVYTAAFTPSTTPLTAIANTSLLTLQSATFTDNSTNNFAITNNGDTAPRQFNPFGWTTTTGSTAAYTPALYGGSGYLDGSGDYLDLGVQPNLYLNSSTYTIECWVYFIRSPGTANAGTLQAAMTQGDGAWFGSANEHNWYLLFEPSQVNFGKQPTTYTASYTPVLNVWTHVAIVGNSSGTITMYINGVSLGTQTSRSALGSASWATRIGLGFYGDSKVANYFQGYITDVRITKGTARYNSNFQPPVAPLTALQNTVLLNNMTGAGIYDSSMITTYETAGNASISTSIKKYGNTSLAFDGSGDALASPANINLAVGSGDFTIEMWVNGANNGSAVGGAFPRLFTLGTAQGVGCIESYNASGTMYVDISGAGGPISFTASTLLNSTWNHYAITRSGTSLKAFVNGTQVGTTATNSTNLNLAATTQSWIGAISASAGNFNGYIDDLRITKGVARYTSNFTPPTTPFITN